MIGDESNEIALASEPNVINAPMHTNAVMNDDDEVLA